VNITKDQVLGFSIIDSRLKIFVKQGSIISTNQQSSDSNNSPKRIVETLYAYTPVDDIFQTTSNEVSNNRYMYELNIFEDNTGEVDLISNSQKALNEIENYIKPACNIINEIEFRGKVPSTYKTVEKGKVLKKGSNYKLIDKIKIKFE